MDRENLLVNIQEFPDQCQNCWNDWKKIALPANYIQAKNVLILGIGGSAIGGSLVSDLAKSASIQIDVSRNYHIPGYVNKDTLIIAISYSGNTEEPISALREASEKTKKIITISTGGKIASLSTNYRTPHYKINYGSQPRQALGYLFISLIAIFSKLDILEIKDDDIKEAIILVQGLQKKIDVGVSTGYNNAKILAQKLQGKIPIIYGSGYLEEVARRWKGEFNENAKSASFFETIPELNHNSLVGLQFPENLKSKIFVIILQSKFDHPRNKLRQEITSEILQKNRINHELVYLKPSPTALSEILQVIHFGDYVSYYLAILNNVEPEPVEIIRFLKDKLTEKPMDEYDKKR